MCCICNASVAVISVNYTDPTSPGSSIEVYTDRTSTFRCVTSESLPPPTVTWHIGDRHIPSNVTNSPTPSEGCGLSDTCTVTSTLRYRPVYVTDNNQTIYCRASNVHGVAGVVPVESQTPILDILGGCTVGPVINVCGSETCEGWINLHWMCGVEVLPLYIRPGVYYTRSEQRPAIPYETPSQ
jgi:hypothetical protein